jgi:hypothetical protein
MRWDAGFDKYLPVAWGARVSRNRGELRVQDPKQVSQKFQRKLTYRYPIVSSPEASGTGTSTAIADVARDSVENFGKPMPCATSPLVSSSE